MLHLDFGKRETGKTTLALFLARQTPQRLIFDPRDGIQPGADAIKVYRSIELTDDAMPLLIDGAVNEVIFTPTGNDLDQAFFIWSKQTKRWVQDMSARPLAVVIDECAMVGSSLDRAAHPIQAAMRFCPRHLVHFYLTAHRPGDIPTRVRAISDYWIIFHMNQEHDLKVIDQRCGEYVTRKVEQLHDYQFVVWDDARGVLKPSILQPKDWYVDLQSRRSPARAAAVILDAPPIPAVDAGALWK